VSADDAGTYEVSCETQSQETGYPNSRTLDFVCECRENSVVIRSEILADIDCESASDDALVGFATSVCGM